MAFGTNHMVKTDYDGSASSDSPFVPELWSDEVVAAYKKNLVLAGLVTQINHVGKKGDAVHIPSPSRGTAYAKAEETIVTFQAPSATRVLVNIDKHYEHSILIEDLLSVQAMDSLRMFHTDDAGYALARQVDFDLHVLGTGLQGGTLDTTWTSAADHDTLTYDAAVIGGDGSTAWDATTDGNGTALTDAGIRKMIQTLDDVDTPQDNRALVVPPVEKKNLLGLARYTEQAFVGDGSSIRTGKIGDIYGVEVYVSTNCPQIIDVGGTTEYRVGLLLHKGAFVLAEQLSIRSQAQYKQEYLAWLYTADTIYGVAELRDDAGIAFVVPA